MKRVPPNPTEENFCAHCGAKHLLLNPLFLDQMTEALIAAGAPNDPRLSIFDQIDALKAGSDGRCTTDNKAGALEVTVEDRHLFKMIVTGMVGPTKHKAIDAGNFDAEARMQYIARHRQSAHADLIAENERLREAARKIVDGAERPGTRRGLNMGSDGEDIDIPYHEVEDSLLDDLRATLSNRGPNNGA